MPDLTAPCVKTWFDRDEPALSSAVRDPSSPLEAIPSLETALAALGITLDETRQNARRGLFDILNEDPAQSAFRAVLAQLGGARMLLLVDWLAAPDSPKKRTLFAALVTPNATESSEPLVLSTLRELNRHVLILRIFGQERLAALYVIAKNFHPQAPRDTP